MPDMSSPTMSSSAQSRMVTDAELCVPYSEETVQALDRDRELLELMTPKLELLHTESSGNRTLLTQEHVRKGIYLIPSRDEKDRALTMERFWNEYLLTKPEFDKHRFYSFPWPALNVCKSLADQLILINYWININSRTRKAALRGEMAKFFHMPFSGCNLKSHGAKPCPLPLAMLRSVVGDKADCPMQCKVDVVRLNPQNFNAG